jgi:hypothetical protein
MFQGFRYAPFLLRSYWRSARDPCGGGEFGSDAEEKERESEALNPSVLPVLSGGQLRLTDWQGLGSDEPRSFSLDVPFGSSGRLAGRLQG